MYQEVKARYLFESRVWGSADFMCFTFKHCWRYPKEGRLGQFLDSVRFSPILIENISSGMERLLFNNAVDEDESTVSCCKREANCNPVLG